MDLLKESKVMMVRNGWGVDEVARIWGIGRAQTSAILNGRSRYSVERFELLLDKAGYKIKIIEK
jgi:hypothetical protein